MQVLAVNWFLLRTTGSATAMGVGVLLQALPAVLLGPYAGALADRVRPRPLLLATQLAQAGLAGALAGAVAGGAGGVGTLYALTTLSGVAAALAGPALGRFGAMVVGRAELANALALGSLINSTGRILGMGLGGVLVVVTSPAVLFGVNAASFLAVVAAVLLMRPGRWHPLAPAGDGGPGTVRAGLAYLAGRPVVLVTLGLAVVLGSLGRNYQVTMAAMSAGPLAAGGGGYGLLSTVFAAGTVVGALVAAGRARLGYPLLVGAGAVASGLQLLAGLAPGLTTFAVLLVPIAAAAVVVDTTVSARLQLDTRDDMRGRVLAAIALVGSLAGMAGAPALGWLSETLGPRSALVLAGAVGLAGCAVAAAALARLGRTPQPAPAA
jgi:MFS family permease